MELGIAEKYSEDYMFMACIAFINSVSVYSVVGKH